MSPNHLPLVNVALTRGRFLQTSDRRGAPSVMVVNQSFKQKFFPREETVGKQILMNLDGTEKWIEIVGVVPDRRNLGSKEHLGPEGYVSATQFFPSWAQLVFLVHKHLDPASLQAEIRDAVKSVDPNVPVGQTQLLQAELTAAINWNLGGTRAISVIALFGLVMALIGIYGVVSYSVTERTYEMGVRMAMGAERLDIIALVVRQGLRYSGIGLLIGLVLGGLTTLGIREMLFGIGALDWLTYTGVCLLLLVTSVMASWFPARRASSIDPMPALRAE
jgi:hypothetical protein